MRTIRGAGMVGGTVALFLMASSGVAQAGGATVKGTIFAGATPDKPVANAVVMIDGPRLPAAADAPHPVIDQRRNTFVPHVLAVAVGTTVDFPNSDPWLHNVSSSSMAKKFDLGMYDQGEVRSVTFETPGVVDVRCNVHPNMKAFVVVHSNPYVAVSNAQGSYTIGSLPPGHYKVRFWHEDLVEEQIPVSVAEGQVQALDVRLKRRH